MQKNQLFKFKLIPNHSKLILNGVNSSKLFAFNRAVSFLFQFCFSLVKNVLTKKNYACRFETLNISCIQAQRTNVPISAHQSIPFQIMLGLDIYTQISS